MTIECDIFKKTYLEETRLIPYGFKKKNDEYIYCKYILNDTFKIDITANKNNHIIGKITDLSLNEEYTNYRIKSEKGSFSAEIRNEFINLLEDIKTNCCTKKYFVSNQSNRISQWIKEKYNDIPKFAWDKFPGYGIFRNPQNDKWYGLIMNIDISKLDKEKHTTSTEVEIINLKLDKNKIQTLLSKRGYYKAYHMNKNNWISILLDETLPDNTIENLIIESHKFTERTSK